MEQPASLNPAMFVLLVTTVIMLVPICGCQKQMTDAEGKKAMESFKGGGETKDERTGDAKAMQDAQDYRKAHPEEFPAPKYNVPQGPKPPTGTGPVGRIAVTASDFAAAAARKTSILSCKSPTARRARAPGALYFHPEEAPELRRRFETAPQCLPYWRKLLANADELLLKPPVSGKFDLSFSRTALGNCGIAAFAYALTGQKPYAARALREAQGLLSLPKWTDPHPANRGANLNTGEAAMACALVYDWCRAAMDESDKTAFRAQLWTLGIQPYVDAIGPFKDWWRDDDITNWTGVVNGGCGLAAMALSDEMPEARAAADFAWKRIVTYLKTANRIDGGGDEGVMYYTYGMLFANYFAVAAARRFGDGGVFRDAVDKMCGYYLVAMKGADDKYANFNDMGDETFQGLPPREPEGGPNATLCALWESKTPGGDRLLAWGADNGGDNWYWRMASPFTLLFRGDSPAVKTRPKLPRSLLFRESGQAIWDAGPGLWFAFNGGWTSDKSHYNLDLGSFVLVANGERLIWDPGYGKVRTGDHSSLLINGQEQATNVSGVYRAWAEGPGWRWLACDLSAAYGRKSPLTRWVRHAILIEDENYADNPMLIFLDDLAAAAPCDWETRLQIKNAPNIAGAGAFVPGKQANLNAVWAAADGVPEVGQGKGASTHLWARMTARSTAKVATALYASPAGVPSTTTTSLGIAAKPDGSLLVTAGTKSGNRVLTFAPTPDGGIQLTAIDTKTVTNTPGPVKRSLRRVA